VHLQQRIGIEADHATQVFGRGRTFFHIENWYSIHTLIRLALRCTGLYGRGLRNATNLQIRHNEVVIPHLPDEFDGFTLLHLSDLHLDMDTAYPVTLIERLQQVDYDICVITGDFRAKTTALTMQRLPLWRKCVRICKSRFTPFSATTIPFG
jgi:hypothetical protein